MAVLIPPAKPVLTKSIKGPSAHQAPNSPNINRGQVEFNANRILLEIDSLQ